MLRQVDTILDLGILEEFKTFPNQGVLCEIIEKNKTGKIFELPGASVLIMENCSDPFVFIAGSFTDEAIGHVISLLSTSTFPMVYCQPKYHALFIKHGWNFHLRVALSLIKPSNLTPSEHLVKIQPINSLELFKKCTWYKERSELYGTDENFLAHGIGYALCIESEVVSEAYASQGGGAAEIGVITHPDYRGKGYAALIVSHLIQQCIEAGITPKWSCNVDNRASLLTALRMGFEINGYYTLLVREFGNVLSQNLADLIKNHSNP